MEPDRAKYVRLSHNLRRNIGVMTLLAEYGTRVVLSISDSVSVLDWALGS
jgi:hypothetical protein